MSPTRAALHTLARQAGARQRVPARPASVPSEALGCPQDTRALRQLLRLREPDVARNAAAAGDRGLPGREIAFGLHLVEARIPAQPLPARLDGAFDRRADFDPRRALFFDTETTGLAGGTGTRAFMLGAAAWDAGTLKVRQLLISRLAAEAAMLAEFARWLGPESILVSYNGKSYDAPLLRARYRLAHLSDPTAEREHIDLLHPTRRRYRGMFENCRLATIEREILGTVRDDDLPGSEAPAAWRSYLRGGSARNLRRVLTHNREDVVSLARLLLHLSCHPARRQRADGAS